MEVADRLKIWWRGVPPSATELKGGGFQLTYRNPSYRTPRERFLVAVQSPFVKWMFGPIMTGVVIAVAGTALAKWLGLL
jgi:hypothetical protein